MKFKQGLRLTEKEKTTVMAEVMRLAVELMYEPPFIHFWLEMLQAEGGGPNWPPLNLCSIESSDGKMGH